MILSHSAKFGTSSVVMVLLTCICPTAGVNLLTPSDWWRHHNGDWHVWAQNAERRGGWTIYPSRRWLISCARTAVLYVCLSIALNSCTTSMAETNLDAVRKQKNAEYSKRYRLKRKMKMQQQAPNNYRSRNRKITNTVSALWYKHRIIGSYRGLIRVTRICRQQI